MDNMVNFSTNLIDLSLLCYFMSRVFTDVEYKKYNNVAIILCMVIINTTINSITGIVNFVGFVAIMIVLTSGFSFIIKKDVFSTFLVLLFGVVCMFILELIVVYSMIYGLHLSATDIIQFTMYKLMAIILAKGSFLLLARKWLHRLPILVQLKSKRQAPFVFILFFNVIIIYMTFILYKYMELNASTDYFVLFSMTAGSLVFSWLIYLFTKKMIHQEQQEMLMTIKLREYENQIFYVKNMEDLMENIRAQRHDLNNYVSTLYGLIHLGKSEEAKKYIMNLEKNLTYFNEVIDTNHPVITALINVKYQKAVREKIKMFLKIDLPDDIPLEYIDLSIILGNVLDNAIEACSKSRAERPFVEFSMVIKDDHLIIKESNSKSTDISVDPKLVTTRFTTKKDKGSHGYGLQNIQRVVEQYNGILQLEDNGDVFNLYIALPMKGDTK